MDFDKNLAGLPAKYIPHGIHMELWIPCGMTWNLWGSVMSLHFEAFWSKIFGVEILGPVFHFKNFLFSIGLFLGLYYTILPCQKCTKIIIVEAIEVAIECHFLLT